jgi:hypothetical protein
VPPLVPAAGDTAPAPAPPPAPAAPPASPWPLRALAATAELEAEQAANPERKPGGFRLGSPLKVIKVAQHVAQQVAARRPATSAGSGAGSGAAPATGEAASALQRIAAPAQADGARPVAAAPSARAVDLRTTWPSDPDSGGWFANGVYYLRVRHPDRFVAIGGRIAKRYLDVSVTALFRKVGGPPGGTYGVIVRDEGPFPRDGVNQDGWFYVFEVNDLGQIGVRRRQEDHWLAVLPWTASAAVLPAGEPNELCVRATGVHLAFLVNGREVAHHVDRVAQAGAVGVFASGDPQVGARRRQEDHWLNEVALDRFSVEVPR